MRIEFFDDFTDLYLMQGFAYCALNNYQAAEASYTRSLEIEPGFVLAHLLRSEVRMKRKNFDGAAQDVAAIRASAEFPTFEPLVRAMQSGTLGCGNFFNPDNTLFQATPTPAPTPPPTTPPTPSPTLETVTSTINVTTVVSSTLPTITVPSLTVPTVTTLRPLPTTTTIFVKK